MAPPVISTAPLYHSSTLNLNKANIFEKITLDQLVANAVLNEQNQPEGNQLILL